jgi:hypothetical protein
MCGVTFAPELFRRSWFFRFALDLHLKRCALRYTEHDRGEAMVVRGGPGDNAAHRRHVVGREYSSERVRHELLGQRRHERVGAIEQRGS